MLTSSNSYFPLQNKEGQCHADGNTFRRAFRIFTCYSEKNRWNWRLWKSWSQDNMQTHGSLRQTTTPETTFLTLSLRVLFYVLFRFTCGDNGGKAISKASLLLIKVDCDCGDSFAGQNFAIKWNVRMKGFFFFQMVPRGSAKTRQTEWVAQFFTSFLLLWRCLFCSVVGFLWCLL